MTPASPTWADVESFLEADGWRRLETGERGGPRSRHVFYEKTLDNGRVLQTHISHSLQKTLSAGPFSSVLRLQLEVSRDEFWECIRTGNPVARPSAVEEAPIQHEVWVIDVLVRQLHMSTAEIEGLSREEAERLVHEHWSRS